MTPVTPSGNVSPVIRDAAQNARDGALAAHAAENCFGLTPTIVGTEGGDDTINGTGRDMQFAMSHADPRTTMRYEYGQD